MVLHEYVHSLQKQESQLPLLGHSLKEGSCDFIAELVSERPIAEQIPEGYIAQGIQHNELVWNEFKQFIPSNEKGRYYNWLYGSSGRELNNKKIRDLGYYMGYAICKSYYEHSSNKSKAINHIIEMDVSTDEKARHFLLKSSYVPQEDLEYVEQYQAGILSQISSLLSFRQMGFSIENDQIVFSFEPSKEREIEYVTIAGSFYAWNPNDKSFKMTQNGNKYIYKMPKSSLKEKQNEFKFVVNETEWQDVPELAKNARNGNFSLDM